VSLAVSLTEARCRGGEEVHLVEVQDGEERLLCRLFLQPTDEGCQVQLDSPEETLPLRVFPTDSCVLVGVRREPG